MELFNHPEFTPLIERLGWTLIHSTWLIAAVWLLAEAARLALHRARATARYVVACVGLSTMAAAPIAAFALMPDRTVTAATPHVSQSSEMTQSAGVTDATPTPRTAGEIEVPVASGENAASMQAVPVSHAWSKPAIPWLVGAWLIGITLLPFRPLFGLHSVHRLRRQSLQDCPDWLREMFSSIRERLGIRRPVEVAISTAASVPCVIGLSNPLVLVPVSTLGQLTRNQMELILTHELAHVRRLDLWVNAAQIVIETLFFYHPCIWHMSRQLRLEREHCCDDDAIADDDERLDYCRALASVGGIQFESNALTMGADGGVLLQRIRRISGRTAPQRANAAGWPLLIGLLAGLSALGVLSQTEETGAAEAQAPRVERTSDASVAAKQPGNVAPELKNAAKAADRSKPKSPGIPGGRWAYMRPEIEKDIPLDKAIAAMNAEHDLEPPLTKFEVRAAVSAIPSKATDMSPAIRKIYQRILDDDVLPAHVAFLRTTRWGTLENAIGVEWLDIVLWPVPPGIRDPETGFGYRYRIRDRFVDMRSLTAEEKRDLARRAAQAESIRNGRNKTPIKQATSAERKGLQNELDYTRKKRDNAARMLTVAEKEDPSDPKKVAHWRRETAAWSQRVTAAEAKLKAANHSSTASPTTASAPGPISIGDTLEIYVLNHDKLNGRYQVRGGGYIVFMPVGRIEVAGQDVAAVVKRIKTALSQHLRSAEVMVELHRNEANSPATKQTDPRKIALKRGDTIELFVLEDPQFNGRYTVRQGGYIIMPRVGRVGIAGKTPLESEQIIKAELLKDQLRQATPLVEPTLNQPPVAVTERGFQLAGELDSPGWAPLNKADDPLSLKKLLIQRGLKQTGDLKNIKIIQIRDGSANVRQIDLERLLDGSDNKADFDLKQDDVVVVPKKRSNAIQLDESNVPNPIP